MSRIQRINQAFQDFRQESALPWWKASYAEFLLQRAKDYAELGREEECNATLSRVEMWLDGLKRQRFLAAQESNGQVSSRGIKPWPAKVLESTLGRLRFELDQRRSLIPNPERDALLQRLSRVEESIGTNRLEQARAELNAVRALWIRRMTRSYRAWSAVRPQSQPTAGQSFRPNPEHAPIGPYNNRLAIQQMMHLVGERDPIWIEDMVEVYNDLFHFAERLGDSDSRKKAAKSSKS